MNKQPPIELISRSDTDFYILLTDRETLQQWAQNGMAWQQFAVRQPFANEAQEHYLFQGALAMSHHYDALLFQLPDPTEPNQAVLAQMGFVCRLYDLFLARKVPPAREVRQWQAQIWETGVLPYGQPSRPQSVYTPLACALVPQLKPFEPPRPH